MKELNSLNFTLVGTALAVFVQIGSAQAGTFAADFNDGLVPANVTVYGSAAALSSGGFTNSGYLQFTTASAGGNAAAILGDLDSGVPIVSFTAQYKILLGNNVGYPADGMSFNFAPDLPAGTITEEGAGTGYTVEFDTFFNNDGTDTGPSIDVKVGDIGLGDHGNYTGNELASFVYGALTPVPTENSCGNVSSGKRRG